MNNQITTADEDRGPYRADSQQLAADLDAKSGGRVKPTEAEVAEVIWDAQMCASELGLLLDQIEADVKGGE